MAFKTKEEMFGDGAGFGTQVPISLTNPPGYGTGNRGIGFGEAVTSAIGNRTHYALALNEEDLNARLAVFETDGLDAAYDLGAVATPGGGRTITKDAGAVETVSALATSIDEDVAHFRANALGDTGGGSIGFEFRDRRSGAGGTSGRSGYASHLNLQLVASTTGNTVLTTPMSATLNPAGAGGALVRLDAGPNQFESSGSGDLLSGFDYIVITGSANHDGLYLLGNVTADKDATVSAVDGTTPSFPVSEGVTVEVYRATFGSFGQDTSLVNGVNVCGLGASTPFIVCAGSSSLSSPEAASDAIRVRTKRPDGFQTSTLVVDALGRIEHTTDFDTYLTTADEYYWGNYALIKRYTNNSKAGVGAVFTSDGTAYHPYRYDVLSAVPLDLPNVAPAVVNGVVPFDFDTQSPVTGEIHITHAQANNLVRDGITPHGTLAEVYDGSASGIYYVHDVDSSSSPEKVFLRHLDGSVPANFPTTGSDNAIFRSASFIGRRPAIDNTAPLNGGGTTFTAYSMFAGGGEANATVMALFSVSHNDDQHFIRAFQNTNAGTGLIEQFAVDKNGKVWSANGVETTGISAHIISGGEVQAASHGKFDGNVYADFDGGGTGEFLFGDKTAKVRDLNMNISLGQTITTSAWILQNTANGLVWSTGVEQANMIIPVILPDEAVITQVQAWVYGGNNDVLTLKGELFYHDIDYSGVGVGSRTSLGSNTAGGGTYQLLFFNPSAHTIDNSGNVYYMIFTSGDDSTSYDNDNIIGLRIFFQDPGPRNY